MSRIPPRPYPVALLSVLLLAGAALPAQAEQFRYKFKPGQVQHTRISLAGAMMIHPGNDAMRSQFRTVLRQAQKVRSVSGGVVTLEVLEVPISSTATVGGKTERTKEEPTRSLVRVTERGRFISRQRLGGRAAEADSSPLEGADALYGLNFPARDLKPGERWTETHTISGQKVTVTTRFVQRETFRGRKCAKFSSTLSMPLETGAQTASIEGMPAPTGKLLGTVTTYFDPAAGTEVYASGSLTMVMKADLSGISPEAGEMATVTRVNVVQTLVTGKR